MSFTATGSIENLPQLKVRKIIDYVIVKEVDIDELEVNVRRLIAEERFEPYGALIFDQAKYIQVLVKYDR